MNTEFRTFTLIACMIFILLAIIGYSSMMALFAVLFFVSYLMTFSKKTKHDRSKQIGIFWIEPREEEEEIKDEVEPEDK